MATLLGVVRNVIQSQNGIKMLHRTEPEALVRQRQREREREARKMPF
jgi:hypothetical protein